LRDALASWNHVLDADGFEGAVYHETLETFLRLIWADDMGLELAEEYLNTWYISLNRWVMMLDDNSNKWFDKTDTEPVETRDDLLREAFQLALASLTEKFQSEDFRTWTWGTIHDIEFHHAFEVKGGLIKKFFNYGPFPFGGDGETVNRATHEFTKPYQANMTASMRMIIDMADASSCRLANASGQVGMPLQDHYTDLIDQWLAGEYTEVDLDRADIETVDQLQLVPVK